jgi:ABC-type sugar transport system substrate-binding protein
MKWLYKIVLILLIIAVVSSAGFILYLFDKVNSVYGDKAAYDLGSGFKHFSLILNSGDEKYWQDFKEGVIEAGKAYNTATEVHIISEPDSGSKTVEYINIANKSKVDGIIVNGENTPEYLDAILAAAKGGINIVVGHVESVDSSGLYYVGTNYYDYGQQAAKLIARAGGDKKQVNAAVILSDQESSGTDAQSNNMLSGLKKEIEGGKQINVLCTPSRTNALLGAEDLTKSILYKYPEVDVIFCMNDKDTMAAAKEIVRRALVGEVVIVGTDYTEEMKYYMDIGVIYGVIDRNGDSAGKKSVQVLSSAANTFQTDCVYIDTEIVTTINADEKQK